MDDVGIYSKRLHAADEQFRDNSFVYVLFNLFICLHARKSTCKLENSRLGSVLGSILQTMSKAKLVWRFKEFLEKVLAY